MNDVRRQADLLGFVEGWPDVWIPSLDHLESLGCERGGVGVSEQTSRIIFSNA